MKQHNKLVRDKVLEWLDQNNLPYKSHIAEGEEYQEKLFEKLLEEATEVATDKNLDEMADLFEVIEAIKKLKGWTTKDIETARLDKLKRRGGFEKGIILEES